LARRAGIDFALFSYNRLTGRPLPPVDSFRDGVHLWFPAEDVRALRSYRVAGQLTVTQWLRSLAHPQHFATFDWHDPVPSLVGVKGRVWGYWARVRRTHRANRTDVIEAERATTAPT
jgi:hypothetical protein